MELAPLWGSPVGLRGSRTQLHGAWHRGGGGTAGVELAGPGRTWGHTPGIGAQLQVGGEVWVDCWVA